MNVESPPVGAASLDTATGWQDPEDARIAIATWLLRGGAQLAGGDNAGAVAGWLDPAGHAAYVYPEITGYYLQWLAWHALRHGATNEVASRSEAAQGWLCVWAERTDPPQTRVYLGAHAHDWRNDALFFFDVAMVLRGLAWAARAQLLVPDAKLVASLCRMLGRLVAADGMFAACVPASSTAPTPGTRPLPDRWSTRRGPFLAKAAEGVLFAGRQLPGVSAGLVRAAAMTFDASMQWAVRTPHDEAHPLLYTFEGLLNSLFNSPDREDVARAVTTLTPQYDALVATMDPSGHLPEAKCRAGTGRLDIVAQAVRAATLLHPRSDRIDEGSSAPLAKMTRLLVRYITRDGAIPFAPGGSPMQFNVWTAMFVEQALGLVRYRAEARAVPWPARCLV